MADRADQPIRHSRFGIGDGIQRSERRKRRIGSAGKNAGLRCFAQAPNGKRLYISLSIEKLLGWSAAEMIRQSAYGNIHPAHREIVKKVFEGPGPDNPTTACEYLTRRKEGTYVPDELRRRS